MNPVPPACAARTNSHEPVDVVPLVLTLLVCAQLGIPPWVGAAAYCACTKRCKVCSGTVRCPKHKEPHLAVQCAVCGIWFLHVKSAAFRNHPLTNKFHLEVAARAAAGAAGAAAAGVAVRDTGAAAVAAQPEGAQTSADVEMEACLLTSAQTSAHVVMEASLLQSQTGYTRLQSVAVWDQHLIRRRVLCRVLCQMQCQLQFKFPVCQKTNTCRHNMN
eukprot:3314427-Rhodomonas_salina.2